MADKKEAKIKAKDVPKKDEKKQDVKKEKKPSRLSGLAKAVGMKGKQEPKEKLIELKRDPYDVLKFVLMTEKSVRMIELQNKLVFIVDRKSDKREIKAAAQTAFNSKIHNVKTMIDQSGRKKAFIRFAQEGAAGEIAIRLGII